MGEKSRFSNNPLIDIIHYTVHVFIATFDLSQFERTAWERLSLILDM